MSISPTVGGLSTYLSQIKLSGTWQSSKTKYDELVGRIPGVGPTVRELSQRLRASVVNFAQPGRLFEDLGITYIGLVPGSRPPGAALDLPAGARAARARSSSTSGRRRAAASGRPRPTRSGSTARRCRR